MIGETILHYKIVKKLGEGGMGVVYKAVDTKLNRNVALKFLPPHIADDKSIRERFTIEAQAAGSLNHPNIAIIHAIEESDEGYFIVMEYVRGKTVKNIIQSGQMKIDVAKNYALQIAEGLNIAHNNGVIHRDIKSDNIMVTDKGQIKILDFGLAKIEAKIAVTKEGTTLGTAGYMSPEQIRGETVDHRTDIWSWGVVFYEMLSGQLPFQGLYETAMLYSVLNMEPEPLSGLREDLTDELEQIVNRTLIKDPSGRFQKSQDIILNLRDFQEESKTGSKQKKQPEIKAGDSFQDQIDPQNATETIACNFFIDSSASMHGFIKPGISSYYTQVIKELEQMLIRAWSDYSVNYFQFNTGVFKIKRGDFRKAIEPDFYKPNSHINDTNINSVFAKKEHFENDALSIIVTDLFENDSDIDLLIKTIRKVVKEHNLCLGLLGIKSQYDGTVDNISEKNFRIDYKTKGKSSLRPFYILMIGSYGNILQYFKKLETSSLKQVPNDLYNFTIFAKDVLFPPISYTDSQIMSIRELAVQAGKQVKVENLVRILKIDDSRRQRSVIFRFKLNYLPYVLTNYFDEVATELWAMRKGVKTFTNNPEITRGIKVKLLRGDFASFDLKVEIDWHKLPKDLPYYCSIDLKPSVNYSRNPLWFSDWNMRESSLETRVKKRDESIGTTTYNLNRFLNSLSEIYKPEKQNIFFILKK